MKRLSIGIRFSLAILIFSIPIVVMVYYIWKTSQDVVQFSIVEKAGLDRMSQATVVKKKSLDLHFKNFSSTPPSQEEWSKLNEEWASFIHSLSDLKVDEKALIESVTNYTSAPLDEKRAGGRFVTTSRDLAKIREAIADNHNIMLDPDSDSYYTMDLVISLIPRLADIYGEMGQIVSSTDPELIEMSRDRFTALAPAMEDVVKRILSDLKKVKDFDEAYYGSSEHYQKNYAAYDQSIRDQLKLSFTLFGNVEKTMTNKAESLAKIKSLIEQSEGVSDNLYTDFKIFVDRRIEVQTADMQKKVGFAIFSLFIAILFSSYLGVTINGTLKTFNLAVKDLQDQADNTLRIGQTLIDASSKVSDSAGKQAAVIEETSASLEEMTSMVSINSQHSVSAQELATEAHSHASEGSKEMQHLMQNMEKITESSKRIEDIMNLIDDIAFQTNLLALNAAVEAARAGDHGKGFAVVAEAVRNLAQKSSVSAKEISDLIKTTMIDIKVGQDSAQLTSSAVDKILSTVEKVKHLNNEIAQASREQTSGINSIGKAMSELEKSTIENSSVARSTAEHSEQAMAQAENLSGIVKVLDNELHGRAKDSKAS